MWAVYHTRAGDKLVRTTGRGRGAKRKVIGQKGRFASYVVTLPGDETLASFRNHAAEFTIGHFLVS